MFWRRVLGVQRINSSQCVLRTGLAARYSTTATAAINSAAAALAATAAEGSRLTLTDLCRVATEAHGSSGDKIDPRSAAQYLSFIGKLEGGGESPSEVVSACVALHQRHHVATESRADAAATNQRGAPAGPAHDYSVLLICSTTNDNEFALFDVGVGEVVWSGVKQSSHEAQPWDIAQTIIERGCLARAVLIWDDRDPRTSGAADRAAQLLLDQGLHILRTPLSELLARSSRSVVVPPTEAFRIENLEDKSTVASAFHELWRTVACAVSLYARPCGTPLKTLMYYTCPQAVLRTVHVARFTHSGSDVYSVVLRDPESGTEQHCRGSLGDAIQRLLQLPSPAIFIPTYRSDRKVLMVLRHALQQSGKRLIIVFPTDVSELLESTPASFSSNLREYWNALRGQHQTDADLVLRVREAAGAVLRRTQETVVDVNATAVETQREALGYSDESAASGALNHGLRTPSAVDSWLAPLYDSPERRALEESTHARLRQRPLFISWLATDSAAHGRAHNPTALENHLLGVAFSDTSLGSQGTATPHLGKSWMSPCVSTTRGQVKLPSLAEYDVLVLHDAKDFLLLLGGDAELDRFLKRGGVVWCLTVAEYLLSAQRFQGDQLALPSIAVRRGLRMQAIGEVLTKNRCDVETANEAIVARHLKACDALVPQVFAQQIASAKNQAQLISIAHRMDALLAFADMERRGIYVNASAARAFAVSQASELVEIDAALHSFLPRNFPVDCRRQMDWTCPEHLKAYFLGGTVSVGGLPREPLQSDRIGWTTNLLIFAIKHGFLTHKSMSSAVQTFATKVLELPSPNQRSTADGDDHHLAACRAVAAHLGERAAATQLRVVMLDLESTGLNLTVDEMVEVACYDPVEKTQFSTLVNPQRHIPRETVRIHGITAAMVKDSPSVAIAAQMLADYLRLGERTRRPGELLILTAHNAFKLDEPLIRRTLSTHCPDARIDDVLFCDSLALLKRLRARTATNVSQRVRDATKHSLTLGSLVHRLDIPHDAGSLHRAVEDAKLLWKVLVSALHTPQSNVDNPRAHAASCLAAMASSVQANAEAHCFCAPRPPAVNVTFPGALKRRRNYGGSARTLPAALLRSVESDLVSKRAVAGVVQSLAAMNVAEAILVQRKLALESDPLSLLRFNDATQQLEAQHPDGCIRPAVDMTATATSRTTSSSPSGHTFPKASKSRLRSILTSRFGSDGVVVEIDYSQLEIVVSAILSRDPLLVKQLRDGVDFHSARASQFSGKSVEEIVQGCRAGDAACKALRQKAKEFSFQRLYGAGASLIAKSTGLSRKVVTECIRIETKTYSELTAFPNRVRAVAMRPGNPGLPTHFIFELPTGLRVAFSPRDCVHNLPPVKNYPIQAYGAELVQIALGRLYRHFLGRNSYDGKAFVVNFVHDSVWLDVNASIVDEVIENTVRCLSSIDTYVPLAFPSVQILVPLACSVALGENMWETRAWTTGAPGA